MLLLYFQAFLSNELIFFFDTVEPNTVVFLLGLIFLQDFVELLRQFVYLSLELDVLLDEALLLILFGQQFF